MRLTNDQVIPAYRRHLRLDLLLISLLIPLGFAWADSENDTIHTWQFSSGIEQNLLLELFTSEGCSSCPAADRWLSSLKQSPQLWQRIIPVAFHVDYWNDLGWRDAFSSKENSLRQQTYRRQHAVNGVYTPGFVANGQEWRGWFDRSPLPLEDLDQIGSLQLDVTGLDRQGIYSATFINNGRYSDKLLSELTLNVAVLAMDEHTDVRLGENKGKTLHHDFVARALQQQGPDEGQVSAVGSTEIRQVSWTGHLDLNQCDNCAIAAWVNHKNKLAPIQSTGGHLK